MIAYFLTYEGASSRVRHKRQRYGGRPRVHYHDGAVTLIGAAVHLLREDGSVFARRNKCTLFDDTVTPPRLIREDYELKVLRKLKAKLPATWIDMRGNIVGASGTVFMQGPESDVESGVVIQPDKNPGRWVRLKP